MRYDHASGLRHDFAEARPVHAAVALCKMLRSMPAAVEEIAVESVSQQPVCLRLRLQTNSVVHSLESARPYIHQASFPTAAEVVDSMQQHAGKYGLSIRMVVEADTVYAVLSRTTSGTTLEQEDCHPACAEGMAELCS